MCVFIGGLLSFVEGWYFAVAGLLTERDGRIVCCMAEGLRSIESLRLYGQVNKRAWWMPWQLEAKKDVVGDEMPRGAVKHALIRGCPNGETRPTCGSSISEYIAY